MARKSTPVLPPPPAKLIQPRNHAREKLVARIELAAPLRTRSIQSESDLEKAKSDHARWNDFNYEMIRRMFSTEEYADAYRGAGWSSFSVASFREPSLSELIERYQKRVTFKVENLESLAERLDLIDEDGSVAGYADVASKPRRTVGNPTKVFIVHGRDDSVKAVVARFVEKCGLDPVILHERADKGRTLIEKFEQEADVAFAIVLLTPDDVGGLKEEGLPETALKDRARQNVILELGFFIGAIGRNKVMALKKGELELPSDYAGVTYTQFDAGETWKMRLAQELKAAGLPIDLNVALA